MMNKKKYNKKFGDVMREYYDGSLHSGKRGPGKGKKVKSPKQAKAIAASEARQSALLRMRNM
jgi:hypothetical protein